MLKSVFVSCSSKIIQNCLRPLSTSQAQNNMEKFALSKKYQGLEKNVWVEFVKLALEYQPLNLGQGLPDDLVPHYVLQSLSGKIILCINVRCPQLLINLTGIVVHIDHHQCLNTLIYVFNKRACAFILFGNLMSPCMALFEPACLLI